MRKPSITYWNRVEPSPRADSLVRGLEAAVRDPLWFLARQWQMGEFQGEDAASPAYVTLQARTSKFRSWSPAQGESRPLDGGAPLEALVQAEEATPDWRTAVELGQALARMLAAAGAGTPTLDGFRTAFPVPLPGDIPTEARRDDALVRFLRVCGGRSIDGVAAYMAAVASAPAVPAGVNFPSGDSGAVQAALADFVAWVEATHGPIGRADAPAWRPDRLDYEVAVTAVTPGGAAVQMNAHAGPFGEFDWFAFDESARGGPDPEAEVETLNLSLFPTTVDFAGMPNARWWQFEDARFNWSNVDTDRRDIAKAMVLDFMLVQGNDWFLVPFGQAVGSLLAVDALLVRDVFGELTLVPRADADAAVADSALSWTMYSTTVVGDGRERRLADYFILPPTALRSTLDGPDLEEVRFLRDEQSNLVWGVEALSENGIGRPWAGRERAQTVALEPGPQPPTDAPLRYRLQTTVPVNWIPFLPVQIDAARRAVALERAAMQRFVEGTLVTVSPVGRILQPSGLEADKPYRVREEEVTRAGVRVLRAARRSRWSDGSTHVWVSRRRKAGRGEGASGLRYDIAERTKPESG